MPFPGKSGGGPLRRVLASVSDLFIPRVCAGCGKAADPGENWCGACISGLPWLSGDLCPRCGAPVPQGAACEECAGRDPGFDAARSAVLYAKPVPDLVKSLKFGAVLHRAPPLSDLLARVLAREAVFSGAGCVVPVPLHPLRLRERGFNQSAVLARGLARAAGLAFFPTALFRTRPTTPQTRLGREERLRNVAGAFAVARPGEIFGRFVVLVDDVFTTGTTLSECARALKGAGARGVAALTVARALRGVHRDDDHGEPQGVEVAAPFARGI